MYAWKVMYRVQCRPMGLTSDMLIDWHAYSSAPKSLEKELEGQQATYHTAYRERLGNKTETQFHSSSDLYTLKKQDVI